MSDLAGNEERDLLAAEYALRLLDGEAETEARRLVAADPAFAEAVAAWEERLAPLVAEVGEVEPPRELIDRIRRAVAEAPQGGAAILPFRRKLGLWQGYAAAVTAVAASLALFLAYDLSRAPSPVVVPDRPAVMVATLASGETEASLAVAYDAAEASLLVTPGRLVALPGRDYQLWIIPEGRSPISLGVIPAAAPHRLRVPAEASPHFGARSTLAVSVEPAGGSPTGQPTGPVVATGNLLTV